MLGGGAIAAMVQSIKNRRDIAKDKHKPFKKSDKPYRSHHRDLKFKEVPLEQKEQFLQKLKKNKEREKRIRIVLWMIGIIVTAISFYLIIV